MWGAASSSSRRPRVWGKGKAGQGWQGRLQSSASKQGAVRLDRAVCRRRWLEAGNVETITLFSVIRSGGPNGGVRPEAVTSTFF